MKREFYDAVRKGNLDLVEKMLSADPSLINKKDEDCTPLNWAAEAGQFEMVKYLINKGADVNSRNDIKDTPLKRACSMITDKKEQSAVYYTIAKLLIEHGADVNAKCGVSAWGGFDLNQTPLHSAAKNGNFVMVKLLVEYGADVNAKNWQQYTPLHEAVRHYETEDMVNYLISKGADVEAIAKDKDTPTSLFMAIAGGYERNAEVIISRGANIYAKNNKGENPLDLVERIGRQKEIEFLWPYYHPSEPYKPKPKPSRGFPPLWKGGK